MKIVKSLSILTLLFGLLTLNLDAQTPDPDNIAEHITQPEIELNIKFLAADELLGRKTGTPELDIAARYIASWFESYGVEYAPGQDSYFQTMNFEQLKSPEEITFSAGDSTYHMNSDLILLNKFRGELNAPVIYLDHATEAEISEADVSGKIIITQPGIPGQTDPRQFFMVMSQKNTWAKQAGAVAVIELYNSQQIPWMMLVNFLTGDRMGLAEDTGEEALPHLWMNSTLSGRANYLSSTEFENAAISVTGNEPELFASSNVIGVLPGTDPDLTNEYILLSAHYDHVGVNPDESAENRVYNGARDNAVGTAAIMSAAKYLAENRPRRSVIFAAWTAEEEGLLGSRYFAENPFIPINQIVYNLNIDGAGYNDTSKVTIIGLGRTEADDELKASAEAFGLEAIPDPVPEQNLFDRSDNVNFASRGVPAPTYSMGITAFDDEINATYHQVTDEAHTIDYEYVTAYIRSFVFASKSIANLDEAPFWLPGDTYEEAGKQLYGIE